MIHILWATLRPDFFKHMHKEWMNRSKNPSNIKTHVAVNWDNHANEIKAYLKPTDRIITVSTSNIGVCYPSYMLSSTLEYKKDDIIVFASDDFMAPFAWDEYLINKLNGKEGGLMVRDGYQAPDSSNMLHPAITIPIMTGGCLEKMNNIIYHPAFTHMFSDCELYMNLKDLGLLIDDRLTDTTTFEHHHYAAGKRKPDQNDQAYNIKWKDDELTWHRRRFLNVLERIKI
jgi:hypothetical protein